MLITVLFASPRADGVTARLTEAFLSNCPTGAEIRRFDAYEMAVAPCIACNTCEKTGSCVMHDTDEFLSACGQSDVLLLATPVYNYSVPAPLKALFDRLQPLFAKPAHNPESARRKGFLLVVCGASGLYSFDIVTRQVKNAFSELGFTLCGTAEAPLTDTVGLTDEELCKAKELAALI